MSRLPESCLLTPIVIFVCSLYHLKVFLKKYGLVTSSLLVASVFELWIAHNLGKCFVVQARKPAHNRAIRFNDLFVAKIKSLIDVLEISTWLETKTKRFSLKAFNSFPLTLSLVDRSIDQGRCPCGRGQINFLAIIQITRQLFSFSEMLLWP